MSDDTQLNKKRRGRPLAFDRQDVLRRAMRLFWERGYEGTTFEELAAVMGISASSFQNSFGSKQRLYVEVIDLYLDETSRWFVDALTQNADTKEAFRKLIDVAADELTRCDRPAGCMISLAGTHMAPECDQIREMMMAHRVLSEEALKERLQKGIADGDLPPRTDAAMLAAFFSTVFRGMAVQARDGASRERLCEIGQLAMQAWPVKS
jgi:AcrR family transcriptional regulator